MSVATHHDQPIRQAQLSNRVSDPLPLVGIAAPTVAALLHRVDPWVRIDPDDHTVGVGGRGEFSQQPLFLLRSQHVLLRGIRLLLRRAGCTIVSQ